jgi:alpha-ribazole phosphatase
MARAVYLIRHAAPEGWQTRRFIGHLDVPLSDHGERQAKDLAARLAQVRFDAIYTSDLSRTRRTAELVAGPHGLEPIAAPALREFAMGQWEGLTAEEIRARDASSFAQWMAAVGEFQFPEGENLTQVAARAWPAFERIAAAHPDGRVAVVAHGGSNRAILCRALGLPLPRILALGQDYAGVSVLERWRGGWRLAALNDAPGDADHRQVGGGAPARGDR